MRFRVFGPILGLILAFVASEARAQTSGSASLKASLVATIDSSEAADSAKRQNSALQKSIDQMKATQEAKEKRDLVVKELQARNLELEKRAANAEKNSVNQKIVLGAVKSLRDSAKVLSDSVREEKAKADSLKHEVERQGAQIADLLKNAGCHCAKPVEKPEPARPSAPPKRSVVAPRVAPKRVPDRVVPPPIIPRAPAPIVAPRVDTTRFVFDPLRLTFDPLTVNVNTTNRVILEMSPELAAMLTAILRAVETPRAGPSMNSGGTSTTSEKERKKGNIITRHPVTTGVTVGILVIGGFVIHNNPQWFRDQVHVNNCQIVGSGHC